MTDERALVERAFIDAYDPKHPTTTLPFVVLEDGRVVAVTEGDPLLEHYPSQAIVRTHDGMAIRIVMP